MDKFQTELKDKAEALGYPDLVVSLRDMKDQDIQKLLEFVLLEIGSLRERVALLEKGKV
jgi:hypothetical protein